MQISPLKFIFNPVREDKRCEQKRCYDFKIISFCHSVQGATAFISIIGALFLCFQFAILTFRYLELLDSYCDALIASC